VKDLRRMVFEGRYFPACNYPWHAEAQHGWFLFAELRCKGLMVKGELMAGQQ
jgi:hypothetical protein